MPSSYISEMEEGGCEVSPFARVERGEYTDGPQSPQVLFRQQKVDTRRPDRSASCVGVIGRKQLGKTASVHQTNHGHEERRGLFHMLSVLQHNSPQNRAQSFTIGQTGKQRGRPLLKLLNATNKALNHFSPSDPYSLSNSNQGYGDFSPSPPSSPMIHPRRPVIQAKQSGSGDPMGDHISRGNIRLGIKTGDDCCEGEGSEASTDDEGQQGADTSGHENWKRPRADEGSNQGQGKGSSAHHERQGIWAEGGGPSIVDSARESEAAALRYIGPGGSCTWQGESSFKDSAYSMYGSWLRLPPSLEPQTGSVFSLSCQPLETLQLQPSIEPDSSPSREEESALREAAEDGLLVDPTLMAAVNDFSALNARADCTSTEGQCKQTKQRSVPLSPHTRRSMGMPRPSPPTQSSSQISSAALSSHAGDASRTDLCGTSREYAHATWNKREPGIASPSKTEPLCTFFSSNKREPVGMSKSSATSRRPALTVLARMFDGLNPSHTTGRSAEDGVPVKDGVEGSCGSSVGMLRQTQARSVSTKKQWGMLSRKPKHEHHTPRRSLSCSTLPPLVRKVSAIASPSPPSPQSKSASIPVDPYCSSSSQPLPLALAHMLAAAPYASYAPEPASQSILQAQARAPAAAAPPSPVSSHLHSNEGTMPSTPFSSPGELSTGKSPQRSHATTYTPSLPASMDMLAVQHGTHSTLPTSTAQQQAAGHGMQQQEQPSGVPATGPSTNSSSRPLVPTSYLRNSGLGSPTSLNTHSSLGLGSKNNAPLPTLNTSSTLPASTSPPSSRSFINPSTSELLRTRLSERDAERALRRKEKQIKDARRLPGPSTQ